MNEVVDYLNANGDRKHRLITMNAITNMMVIISGIITYNLNYEFPIYLFIYQIVIDIDRFFGILIIINYNRKNGLKSKQMNEYRYFRQFITLK